MPADASPRLNRRTLLGLPEEATAGHISSLVVRAHPDRLAAVVRRIAALSVAEVALSDPSGKIVVTLETLNEDEIVAAMNAMQAMRGVVSVALVYHQSEA
jgi:periplasmic nitrate reductase NapD